MSGAGAGGVPAIIPAVFDVGEQAAMLPCTEGDVLRNDAFGYRNEADLLADF